VPLLTTVNIFNSETKTEQPFGAREDRIRAFYQFIVGDRRTANSAKPRMPGISGPAALGLSTMFFRVPGRFPADDILKWLRENQKTYLDGYPNPTITLEEIEDALGRFAAVNTQLLADGQDSSSRQAGV
jgi:hypothetical protein